MTSEYTVLWVDDNKDRREGQRDFGRDDRVEVVPLEPLDLAGKLLGGEKDVLEDKKPDLALVDWYLQTDGYSGDGPSIEGILHDRYPELPVYGFSSEYGDQQFMREQKRGENRFEIITGPDRLKDEDIIQDIESYRRIVSKKGEKIDGILDLLEAEDEIKQKIQSILPQEFVEGIPSGDDYEPGGILRFARWVRGTFLSNPGLVWDETWTSTKLGIDPDAFEDYCSTFSADMYEGIFSNNVRVWWRPKVTSRVYKLAAEKNKTINRTWKDAPDLLEINKDEIAKCSVCKRNYPEAVAAGKVNEEPEFPVHYECSNIENSRGSTFEDLRVLVKE